jgi:hypothetical protein
MIENQTICELVRDMEAADKRGKTTIGKYVKFDMRENLEKIDAYKYSKHISGKTDFRGREKPFFNIVTAARNIWYRATDIDRKHIKIKANKSASYVLAFLATIKLQEFMRKNIFGKFLNKMGRTQCDYGSAILKFIEKDNKLHCDVMPWNRMIVDAVDFDNNPKIEKIWLTPAQLQENKDYDQELVKKLLDAHETRETTDGQKIDNKDNYILLYELHGNLTLSTLKKSQGKKPKDGDDEVYRQQMHVVTYLEKKDSGDEYEDYTLISGKEAKDPFMIAHLLEEDGRTQSIGAIENLFEAQWMVNHSAKCIKDQLDIASKIIFQTADPKFLGRNALAAMEQGNILIHTPNAPLTQLNNKADITASQSFQAQWKQLGNEINGISEAMLGASAKSGTAWRQTEALLQESHDLFELMRENRALDIEKIMRVYVIPHLKKQLNTSEEISETLEDYQITQLDAMFLPNEVIRRVNQKIKNAVLSGKAFTPEQQDEETRIETDNIQKMLAGFGNQRFIKPSDITTQTWKKVFKDFEWETEIHITDEAKDTQAVMTTLSNVLKFIVGLQGRPMSQEEKLVFNKILENVSGISPIEISQIRPAEQPQPSPVAPTVGRVGAGQPELAPA